MDLYLAPDEAVEISADDLPDVMPEHIKAKLLAHARSLAIILASQKNKKRLQPQPAEGDACPGISPERKGKEGNRSKQIDVHDEQIGGLF